MGLIVLLLVLMQQVSSKAEEVKAKRTAQRKTGPQPVNVVTLTLAPSTIREKVTLPAEILPRRILDLPVEVSASLMEKSVSEGTHVSTGDVVARLDDARYAARLEAARSSLAQAEATQKRMKNLHQSKLATDADVENALTAFQQANSALVSARLDLDRCIIKAPFSGFVDLYTVEKGAFLSAGMPVARLLDISTVKVRLGVPESDITKATTPDAFNVYIPALGETPLQGGRILRTARKAGNMAKLFDMDLVFDNPKENILPDMFARVELVKEKKEDALVVPLYSVITRDNAQVVYVANGDKAALRQVVTGIQEGWLVEIREGLEAGDNVIVTGHRSVDDGRGIHVVKRIDRAEDLTP